MAKIWLATVKEGKMSMAEYVGRDLRDWMKDNEGKQLRVEIQKPSVSDEMRGYYFAAVIPFVKELSESWKLLSNEDMHEVLKKQFNYFETWNDVTKRVERYGRTIMSEQSNTPKAMEFIDKISVWVSDNYGLSLPNPEEYKDLRDRGLL